jgi:ATPase subunit of ABC transporter with duplicated ATPase domains
MSKTISPVILAAQDLAVRYGPQVVLKNATLNVHQADRIGLIGNNGSGKSTLLRIIAGDMQPDSGSLSRRRDIITGYLPQNFQLDPTKTVYENIVEGRMMSLIFSENTKICRRHPKSVTCWKSKSFIVMDGI